VRRESDAETSEAASSSTCTRSSHIGVQVHVLDALPIDNGRQYNFSFAQVKASCSCDEQRRKDCNDLCRALLYFLFILFPLVLAFVLVEHVPRVYERGYTECEDFNPTTSLSVSKYTFKQDRIENKRELYDQDGQLLYSFQYSGSKLYTITDVICSQVGNALNLSRSYCVEPTGTFGHGNTAAVEIYPKHYPNVRITGKISYTRSNLPYDYIEIVFSVGEFDFLFIAHDKNVIALSRANYDDYGNIVDESGRESNGLFGGGRLPWIGAFSESGELICAPRSENSGSIDEISLYDVESTFKLQTLSVFEAESILMEVLQGDTAARIHLLTIGLINSGFIFTKYAVIFAVYVLFGIVVQCCLVLTKRCKSNSYGNSNRSGNDESGHRETFVTGTRLNMSI